MVGRWRAQEGFEIRCVPIRRSQPPVDPRHTDPTRRILVPSRAFSLDATTRDVEISSSTSRAAAFPNRHRILHYRDPVLPGASASFPLQTDARRQDALFTIPRAEDEPCACDDGTISDHR
jgi:hypothetical protein